MSTSGKVALYKNLAQNANGAEAAKPRYLRSGVYTLLSTSLYIALIEIHVIGFIFFLIFLEYTGLESVFFSYL